MRTRTGGTLIGVVLAAAIAAPTLAEPTLAQEPTTLDPAVADDGCGPATGVQVSQEYRPYEQSSMEPEEPILDGRPGTSIDRMRAAGFMAPLLDPGFGLDVVRVSYTFDRHTGMGSGVVYFSDQPIIGDMTLDDVLIAGGARVHEAITPDGGSAQRRIDDTRDLFELLLGPGRTTDVRVGSHPGVVLLGDEMIAGYRFYSVRFATEDQHTYTLLTGATTADEAVDQARSLVCD